MVPEADDAPVVSALQTTIDHATVDADFYRRRLPPDFRLRSLSDIRILPILSRSDLVRLCDEHLRTAETPPDFIAFTSGTSSSATPSFLYRSHRLEEQRALQHLFGALAPAGTPQPLTIKLMSASHGLDLFGPRQGIFSVPFEQPYHAALIVDLLRRTYRFRDFTERVVSIVAPLNILKMLTAKLMADGVDPADFGVTHVTTYAWRLSPHWDALLRSYWRAQVVDAYGASEVPGLLATRCASCGFFHFERSAFVEFLHLDDDSPGAGGAVRLIATAYYPLAEVIPIVRYDTGDVFYDREVCAASGRRSFEFLGRAQHIVARDASGTQIISLGLIADALDAFGEISRIRETRNETLDVDAPVGTPIFRCTYDARRLDVHVAVQPALGNDDRAALAGAMREAIAARLHRFGNTPDVREIRMTTTDQRASIPAVRL